MSQLALALDANISIKHLSFLEIGRSRPSREMLLHLAACLAVPLRDRNELLAAAGFAPLFQERALHEPALHPICRNVEFVLAAHGHNPALVMDRHWTLQTTNRAVAHLFAGAEPLLLRPPVNLLRLLLHPAGLASRVVNLPQWRMHVIARLRHQIDATGDAVLMDMLEELLDYPCLRGTRSAARMDESAAGAIPFQLATIDGVLSFFTTTTRFGAPVDVTVSELTIEAFLPADTDTAAIMRRAGERREVHRDVWAGALA
jgi:transcriptional regulator with XRE-family HTH domain